MLTWLKARFQKKQKGVSDAYPISAKESGRFRLCDVRWPIFPMKFIQLLFLLSLSALCYADASDSKNELSAELVRVCGIDKIIGDAKQSAEAQARAAADQMFAQFKSGMPGLSDRFWDRMTAAADKMIAVVQKSWSAEEALDVWKTAYCSDLTTEELTQIIAASKTPLGQKQIAAGSRANTAFQQYYVNRSRDVIQTAMKQYVSDLQQIAAEAAQQSK
jgi:hypothetical protein